MIQRWRTNWKFTHKRLLVHAWFTLLVLRIGDFQENYPIRGLERTRKFFLVLKSLVPTQSSQDEEKFSCPFESTDNFPEPFHIPITCHIIFSLLYGYKFWTVNLDSVSAATILDSVSAATAYQLWYFVDILTYTCWTCFKSSMQTVNRVPQTVSSFWSICINRNWIITLALFWPLEIFK
jgi:hypothetical protein